MDDGVTACIHDNQFYMTTTTGGAARVLDWLERWHQIEWPELDVWLTSVTDHWATIAVVGPESRQILQSLCDDIDFSRDAFKFMEWRAGTVAGIAARVFRISFSGELAYEINVAAGYGRHIWEAVMAAGAVPYGTETMHVLRAEKASSSSAKTPTPPKPRLTSACVGGESKKTLQLPRPALTRAQRHRARRPQTTRWPA